MNLKSLSACLFCITLFALTSCSDLGMNDPFTPWQAYDFNGAFTIPIPSHFGDPNLPFSDDVSAGWENGDMSLYILRANPSVNPDWLPRYTDATATPITVDGWRATLVTWRSGYQGKILYCAGLYTLDPDRNNFSYHAWAVCPNLSNRDMAIRMFMSIRFKMQKLG